MKIHAEGKRFITAVGLILVVLNTLVLVVFPSYLLYIAIASLFIFSFILSFFRNPPRQVPQAGKDLVYAPADGRIVAIEEVFEPEYFKDRRLQVSIFMSPANVHVNRNPLPGEVTYCKYHPGKYLVAWHPKSSLENERTTVVIDNGQTEVLIRQIAGFMAKRIVNYLKVGEPVSQGTDMGFIKFGSRVDLLLPLDADVQVSLRQKVKGNLTLIAKLRNGKRKP